MINYKGSVHCTQCSKGNEIVFIEGGKLPFPAGWLRVTMFANGIGVEGWR